jgi:hypothetical protein
MNLKKQIRQVTGTSRGITFTKEEQIAYGLEVGDILSVSVGTKINSRSKLKEVK